MAVTKPVCFTPIADTEVSLDKPITEELVRKLFQNINLLVALAPIGAVEAFHVNQPGAPLPLVTMFQFCNGSEITEPTSPLKTVGLSTHTTPDLRGRYVRGADAGTNSGNELGGGTSIDLTHSHTGFTGDFSAGPGEGAGDGPSHGGFAIHKHIIVADLTTPVTLDLAHITTAYYLKIT